MSVRFAGYRAAIGAGPSVLRLAFALLIALAGGGAVQAAGLEISQFAYRGPDLLVFVKAPGTAAAASATAASAASAPAATVALGDRSLPVKSVENWSPANGAVVVVAMDISQSMRLVDFPAIGRAVSGALLGLPPTSRAGLLTIGSTVDTPVEVGPVSAVTAALESLQADSPDTALNQGLLRAQGWAMEGRAELPLRRFVLLVTDGVDDSKTAIGTEEMRSKVQAGEVPIYMVAVLKPGPLKQRTAALEPLAGVVRASGGAFMASTLATLGTDLQAMLADALTTQMVTAVCDGCVRDGIQRALQVTLMQGGKSIWDIRQVRLLHRVGNEVSVPLPNPAASQPAPQPPRSFFDRLAEILNTTATVVKAVVGIAGAVITFWGIWNRKVIAKQARHLQRTVIALIFGPPGKTDVVTEDNTHSQQPDGGKPVQLTVDVDGVGRQQISVGPIDVVLGRSAKAAISVPGDEEASAKHAALYVEKGLLMLRDLGSSNGTALNGTPIVRAEPVHDHDVIRFGRTNVRVYFGLL